MRCRVTVKLERSGFSPEQARAVAERIGGGTRLEGVTTRGVSWYADAETLEMAVVAELERIQRALGAEGVTSALVKWVGEEIVTPRWASRRVMVGNSPYGPIGPSRPDGGGSAGVREPRRPFPGSGASGLAAQPAAQPPD